jgi:Skp family chaperone for outer membrane proteins
MSGFYGTVVPRMPQLKHKDALTTAMPIKDRMQELLNDGDVMQPAHCNCSRIGSDLTEWRYHELAHFNIQITADRARNVLTTHLAAEEARGARYLLDWIQGGITSADGKTAEEAVQAFLTPGQLPPVAVLMAVLCVLERRKVAIVTKTCWLPLTTDEETGNLELVFVWQGGRALTPLRWSSDSGLNDPTKSAMVWYENPVHVKTESTSPVMISDDEAMDIPTAAGAGETAVTIKDETEEPDPVTVAEEDTAMVDHPVPATTPPDELNIKVYQRRCAALVVDNNALIENTNHQAQVIKDLEAQIKQLREDLQVNQKDATAMEALLTTRAAELKGMESVKRQLQQERDEARGERDGLQKRVETQSRSLEELQRANQNVTAMHGYNKERMGAALDATETARKQMLASTYSVINTLCGAQHMLDSTFMASLPPNTRLEMVVAQGLRETSPLISSSTNPSADLPSGSATRTQDDGVAADTPGNASDGTEDIHMEPIQPLNSPASSDRGTPPQSPKENKITQEQMLAKYKRIQLSTKPLRKRKVRSETTSPAKMESETTPKTPRRSTRASTASRIPVADPNGATPTGNRRKGRPRRLQAITGFRVGATPSKLPRPGMRRHEHSRDSPPNFVEDEGVLQTLLPVSYQLFDVKNTEVRRVMRKYRIVIEGVGPHAGIPEISCPVCSLVPESFRRLYAHMQANHPDHPRPFSCWQCPKSFGRYHDLSKHLERHGERAFGCEVCSAKFHLAEGLEDHLGVHTREHMCKECEKFFANSRALTKHLATHNNPRTSDVRRGKQARPKAPPTHL